MSVVLNVPDKKIQLVAKKAVKVLKGLSVTEAEEALYLAAKYVRSQTIVK